MPCRLATPQYPRRYKEDPPPFVNACVLGVYTSMRADHTAAAVRCFALILLVLSLGACAKTPGPEETLERFLADLRFGQSDKAWAALSANTQKAVTERHHARRKAAGLPAQDPKPADLLYADLKLTVLSAPESVAVASPLGDTVKLRVSVKDGASADIWMVRDGPKWRVDLERSLTATSSPKPQP